MANQEKENTTTEEQVDPSKEEKVEVKEATETPLEDEIKKLKQDLSDSNDKYLRMLAEYDNYRRRSAKEKESTWADAVGDTIKELLPIADNLERATLAQGDAEAIQKGLEMTMNALKTMMDKLGITSFGEKGEPFDPNIHNAVMHEDNPDEKENVIVDVFQKGYKKGDKVIRFAMVKVAN